MSNHYDAIILGSGSTAFAAARRASLRGARVLMVEHSQLGGTCVNWGCVPSKTLIHKAKEYHGAARSRPFGVNLSAGAPDCPLLMDYKQRAVEYLRQEHYQKVFDADPNIDVLRGHGRFISGRELQVGAEVLVSERFLIAVGGAPRTLRLPGLAEVGYLTSYSALHLPCFPKSLVIIGGGVIALEMGQMFRRFGSEVTILERGERLLKEFDPRLSHLLQELLTAEGLRFAFGVEATGAFRDGNLCGIAARVGDEAQDFRAERIMLAVGTAPATRDIGLGEAGVAINDAGFICTDEEMRTTAPGIWAAGDVTGPPLIAPAGAREGELAMDNMLDSQRHRRIDHRHTPMAVFVDPEMAMVGLSAEQARAQGKQVVETYLDLEQVAKAHVMGGRGGGLILCAEAGSGRILGAQLLAPRAADIIHEITLAVRFGLSVFDLAETIHVYPTIADGWRLAALENIRQQQGEGRGGNIH